MTDPQTSGGLLVSAAPDTAGAVLEVFARHGFEAAARIGRIEAADGTAPGVVLG
ncbi:AIR synthase-related protein [Rhodovulum visakhapatnamense]|uniref:AIR synthase-related protein n=1 Tax=Rhodovulum visakhapatnamense TaxID=364297 RepID=UPI002351E680|nr:AIR synthase-related protein [Rhodovulum visakhapatnamense]